MNLIQKARAGFASITIRGGRITKWKGQAGSYAPQLGTAMIGASSSALALGVALAGGLLAPSAAFAGTCDEDPPASGEFLCSGPAGADVTQSPTAPAGQPVVVTTAPGFGLNVGAGNAIGITADAGNTGISITDLNFSTIIGQVNGIFAVNNDTGNVNIVTTGQVTCITNSGIRVGGGSGTGDVIIAAGSTTGQQFGIVASNLGTGQLSVSSSGLASGALSGIFADLGEYGTNLTINAADTRGAYAGIQATHYGSGDLTITSSGTASGTGTSANGIYGRSYGTDLSVAAANTQGGENGIYVRNFGTGALSITSTGTASGTLGAGIRAVNTDANGATSLTINAADSSGDLAGIRARNFGTGALTINSTGTASSMSGSGIDAFSRGDSISITAADSVGAVNGITATNYSTGSLSITATGTATGNAMAGIYATNNGTDLTVIAANTQGGTYGIEARNFGTGALSITSTGTATGLSQDGIFARNNAAGSALSVNAADATGNANGIWAWQLGSGALSVTATGTVEGTAQDGIRATNSASGTDLTIAAAITSGGANGIAAVNEGTSALSVTASGMASGTSGFGISAIDSGTDLSIAAASTSGGASGIYARNSGTGALSITSSGTATGTTGSGIRAINAAFGSDMTITAADTSGGTSGIAAINNGSGALSIITSDPTSGANGDGITATSNGTSLSITANGSVSGSANGINAANFGTAGLSITANGPVTGGSGAAIDTSSAAGNLTTITLDTGAAALAGTSGIAIRNNEGNSALTLASGAAITGEVRLGAGTDTAILSGADALAGVPVLDGGADGDTQIDALNLNAAWSGDLVGANTVNWDAINVNGGAVRFSDRGVTAGLVSIMMGGRLDGSNSLALNGNLALGAGSVLLAGTAAGTGAMSVAGNVTSAGVINLQGASLAVGDRLTIGGNFTGVAGSTIRMDVVLGGSNASDSLVVRGNLGGTSTLVVSNLGGTGSLTQGDGIRLVTVDGTSQAGALSLAGGALDLGAFRYGLFNGGLANPADQDWYLRSRVRDIVVPTITAARLAEDIGLAALGTLNERIGEASHSGGSGADSGFLKGMWGRFIGKDYNNQSAQSAALGNTSSDGRLGGLQLGVEIYRAVAASGARTHIGLFAGHMWSSTADRSLTGPIRSAGTTESEGFVLGGYVTHVGASGWYIDAVLQRDWIDHRIAGQEGTRALTQSNATLASLEVGKAFGTVWQLEPQAQLVYSSTSLDDFADSRGIANRIARNDSVIGRGGLRLKRTWDLDQNSDAGAFTLYAKANLWGRLSGGAGTLAVGPSLPAAIAFRETWGDAGLGASYALGRNAEIFTDFEVEYGIGQSGTAIAGRGGVRLRF